MNGHRGASTFADTTASAQDVEAKHQQAVKQAIENAKPQVQERVRSSTPNQQVIQFFDKHAEDLMKQMRNNDRAGYESTLQDALKLNVINRAVYDALMQFYDSFQRSIREQLLDSEVRILGKAINEDAKNGGDGRLQLQAVSKYQKDYDSVGWNQKRFLEYATEGLTAEQTRRVLNAALEIGFSTSAVMHEASLYENINPSSMMIAQLALTNFQFARELIQLFTKLAEEQDDPKKKERYEQMVSDLKDEGVGEKQFDPRSKAFKDAVEKVNDILERELPVRPKKLIDLHSNLDTSSFIVRNDDFAKRAPKEDT